MKKKIRCCNCGKLLFINPLTETCIYCSYEQNVEHIKYVKLRQAIHDKTGLNPRSYGGNAEYRIKWDREE